MDGKYKYTERHFRETENLFRKVSKDEVASWLLNNGYFPESNILPPSFKVKDFCLKDEPYNKNLNDLTKRQLINISYPKTLLNHRTFSIQHPWNYHDIVFFLHDDWELVVNHLFHKDIRFYSYSLPIPVSKKLNEELGRLRKGRVIYEWITMAENDLVLDSTQYKYIAKTDITNFYPSIYTHSIGWALHGKKKAINDKENELLGNKIDRLTQYSNDAKTNGLSIGSALSDFIAEIVLAKVDRNASNKLSDVDFISVRFKDDYRVLCKTQSDAENVLRVLAKELSAYNLILNDKKTTILNLPDGLYRSHDREYFPYSLQNRAQINFKTFEHTLLIALNIHRKYVGTSILEKFISELFEKKRRALKIIFSDSRHRKEKEIKKTISLLFLAKRESEKILCDVLAIIELIYVQNHKEISSLKSFIKDLVISEIKFSSEKSSSFEVVWYVFFSRHISLGIQDFKKYISNEDVQNNCFVKSMLSSQKKIYADSEIAMFQTPKNFKKGHASLASYLDIFS